MSETISFVITDIQQETATVKSFFLHPANEEQFTYQAGQFITLLFELNGLALRRSYSFSSSPALQEAICITTKRHPNGAASRWMHDELQPGDILQALPAAGLFTIAPQTAVTRDIFLIAAGTGIVPIYSLLKELLVLGNELSITLVYSNYQKSDAVFYEELMLLQEQYPQRLHIEFLFSNHQQILKARLSSTSLKMLLDKHLRFAKHDALIYTCGPYDFMQMVQIVTLTHGFNPNHIRREIFTLPENVAPHTTYINKIDQTITLIKNGERHSLFVPYQQSILTAAIANGIDLPYSCRAGRCSSCRAKTVQGKVQMHYNEVLTDADEEAGYILTCTGHPITDNVIIEAE
jgi:ring-1,2-phenylacetyl-CoA epoxidase subunit PaaE